MLQHFLDIAVLVVTAVALATSIQLWRYTHAAAAVWFIAAAAFGFVTRIGISLHHIYPRDNLWANATLWVTGGYFLTGVAIVYLMYAVMSIIPKEKKDD